LRWQQLEAVVIGHSGHREEHGSYTRSAHPLATSQFREAKDTFTSFDDQDTVQIQMQTSPIQSLNKYALPVTYSTQQHIMYCNVIIITT
jgi:4-hydroxy-3-methylbut-2-enyl diphosphate reductase IspH